MEWERSMHRRRRRASVILPRKFVSKESVCSLAWRQKQQSERSPPNIKKASNTRASGQCDTATGSGRLELPDSQFPMGVILL